MSAAIDAGSVALVLAAHGERQPDADNVGVKRIAKALSQRHVASAVEVGFIKGEPTITEVLRSINAARILVYPLFASNGYFTRDRLVQLIDEADNRHAITEVLAPLGLDPGLPGVLLERCIELAEANGFGRAAAIVLLGHGSRRYPASRIAARQLADRLRGRGRFSDVTFALLEERPSLSETVAQLDGPVIVVGLFSGEGVHGAADARRLVAEVGRSDVIYAGVVAAFPGIERLIESAVRLALHAKADAGG